MRIKHMGTKERREREREELRQSILGAARQIALDEGWNSLTMRKVADRIEYSAPALYEYFESKDAIVYGLMREGFALLTERLRAAYDTTDDPEERLLRVSEAYCEFAWNQTELYQVMHGMGGAHCSPGEKPPPELPPLAATMLATVRSAIGAEKGDPRDVYAALDIFRGILHGLISLTLGGIMQGGQERAKELVRRAVLDWRAGWLSGQPVKKEGGL
jgi:AcrR family transcriptional regulator